MKRLVRKWIKRKIMAIEEEKRQIGYPVGSYGRAFQELRVNWLDFKIDVLRRILTYT